MKLNNSVLLFQKFGFQKLGTDSLDMGTYPAHSGSALSSLGSMTTGGGGSTGASLGGSLPNSPPIHIVPSKHETSEEDDDKDDTPHPRDTQYLTENCVLITYFTGDTASNVDDHFSRALSQPTYTGGTDSTAGGGGGKTGSTWSSSHSSHTGKGKIIRTHNLVVDITKSVTLDIISYIQW